MKKLLRDELYVMLMLQRSEANGAGVDCDDTDVVLACLEDLDNCPAACKAEYEDEGETSDEVVKSGDLAVSAKANKGASVISNWATSDLDTLTFKTSEDITVKSITLERYGFSKAADVASIWLEDLDGNKVTAEKSLSASKDTVTLSIKKDYQTIENGDELVIVITTVGSTTAVMWSKSIWFKVTDVDSSAKNLDLSDYDANLYDIIDYLGTDAKIQLKGSHKDYNYEEWKSYEVAKIKVMATNAAILVKGFTLTQSDGRKCTTAEVGGTATTAIPAACSAVGATTNTVAFPAGSLDLDKFIDEVEVLVDGKAIKAKASLKRDELTITFDEQEIAINKNSTFTVNVTLKDFDEFGADINLWFDDPADVTILEAKNKVRVSVKDSTSTTFNDMYGTRVYTFNGWKINLTNVKLNSTIDAAEGADDVVIAEGKIALAGQAIRIDSLSLQPWTVNDATATAIIPVESVKLVVGDEEFEATAFNTWTVRNIVIDEDATIQVKVDIKDNLNLAPNAAPTFNVTVGGVSSAINKSTVNVKYDDVSAWVAGTAQNNLVGSISVSTVKIQPAKGSLTNDSTKKVEFKVNETMDKTVFKGTYTAKKNGNVNLDTVKIWLTNGNGTQVVYKDFVNLGTDTTDSSDVTFTVKVDGETVATIDNPKYAVNAAASTDDASFSPIAVEAGKSVSVEVVASVFADHDTRNNLEYKIQLAGKDDNGNDAGDASKDLAPIAFVDNSSVNVSTNANMKKQDVVLANKNQNLATFIVKPANKASSATLDSLEFILDTNLHNLVNAGIAGGTDADEYFEVKIGGQNGTVADSLSYNAVSKTLTVSDINMDIDGETEVSVTFKEKLPVIDSNAVTAKNQVVDTPVGNVYVLTLDNVNNGTSLGTTYQYKRVAVNSLVRVESMTNDTDADETRYVFDIEFADDVNNESISSVTFTYASDLTAWYTPAGAAAWYRNVKVWDNVEAGKKYSVDNGSAANYVQSIAYVDADGDTVTLTVNNSNDFFKTNGDKEDLLRAYKAKD